MSASLEAPHVFCYTRSDDSEDVERYDADPVAMKRIPTTFCQYMDTPDRRVVDLSPDGVPEIPVLGYNKATKVRAGAVLHRHAQVMEFTFCQRGNIKFDCNGRVYGLLPGEVFFTRAGDVHRLRLNGMGSAVQWIFFHPPKHGEGMLGLAPDEADWLIRRLKDIPLHLFDGTKAVGEAFATLFAALDQTVCGSVERRVRIRKSALDLLLAFADAGHRPPRKDSGTELRNLVDRMRRSPEADFDIDELISSTQLSPSTLVNRFKRLTGLPPHAFLLKCRIRQSQDELAHTNRPVGEIAAALGFSSAQHFATRFRSETGLTPVAWREMFKKS